jgi:hypothetical protein
MPIAAAFGQRKWKKKSFNFRDQVETKNACTDGARHHTAEDRP